MTRVFDDDPIGSILEYGVLAQEADDARRKAWISGNLRHSVPELLEPFVGPRGSLTKDHLVNMLSHGRDDRAVRERVSRAFAALEHHGLVVAFAGDANLNTSYRSVNDLGRDLFESDAFEEFLLGNVHIVAKWRSSVLRLVNVHGDGVGTGFVVGGRSIATARHVVEDMPAFAVETEDGDVIEHAEVKVHSHSAVDVAVVTTPHPINRRPFRLAHGCDILSSVVVFGYPPIPRSNDAYLVVNRGEVSAKPVLYPDDQQIIVVSCLLRGGNSGGPVVDRTGSVIGIVSQQLFKKVAPNEDSINEGLGFAAATEADRLLELLAS